MIKLYKKTLRGMEYWEAWEDEGKVVTHWGLLGDTGKKKDVSLASGDEADEVIERESKPFRESGFEEIEAIAEIVVHYKCDSWGSAEDLKKRHRVQDLMNECLGWTGNGHCDGGDIGSGSINIYSFVIDPELAASTTIATLREENLLEGATIATRQNSDDEGEIYKVHWPAGFTDKFYPV